MSENELQRDILTHLGKMPGVTAWRCQSGKVKVRGGWMELAPNGTPDIIGFLDSGQFLAIEVKLPGEELRPEQLEWFARAKQRNVLAFVARSVRGAVDRIALHVNDPQRQSGSW